MYLYNLQICLKKKHLFEHKILQQEFNMNWNGIIIVIIKYRVKQNIFQLFYLLITIQLQIIF